MPDALTAKRRLAALSEQLVAPIGDQGKFEDIPILKKIAPDSNGPRVKGKVVIVTGQQSFWVRINLLF